MSASLEGLARGTFVSMLGSLAGVLAKGAEHARAANLEPATLVEGRLAPDMYTLRQQVQLACFHARDAFARLTGASPGTPEELGSSFDDLQSCIRATVAALEATPPAAFAGADARAVVMAVPGTEMVFDMSAEQFLRDWALPHFYFHVVTAYDVLRHAGVAIGKRDYASHVGRYLRALR
jgi:hypothetical protein